MSATSAAIALAATGLFCANIFLLLTLAGAATLPDQSSGTRLWASFGILTVIMALNAYGMDQLGRYFGL